MGENKTAFVAILIALLLLVALVVVIAQPAKVETKYVDVPKYVNVPVAVADNTTIAIRDKLFESDDFEAFALNLAENDLAARGYKDLFEAMDDNSNISIDEKSDISKVIVKDSDVSNIDVDEKNANVELELKVYYEDLTGNDVKSYITVEYSIEDGEVEDVEYIFA